MENNWTLEKSKKIFTLPFSDLVYKAQVIHRKNFDHNTVQVSALASIKTGGCSEDCAYCAQSSHHKPSVEINTMTKNDILQIAQKAKSSGCSRLCMSTSGKAPDNKALEKICNIVKEVKEIGLETCVTLGMLTLEQAKKLKSAGLDFYNHNIETSEKYYAEIVSTHKFADRLQTIKNVQTVGIKTCVGGIVGMGEKTDDRLNMLVTLANLNPQPTSIPINKLVPVPGTRIEKMLNEKYQKNTNTENVRQKSHIEVDAIKFVRIIATTRVMMPHSFIRLSAGRDIMSEELQALCIVCGANSIFYGTKLLTVQNQAPQKDEDFLQKMGLKKM
jgi:biotin synthase